MKNIFRQAGKQAGDGIIQSLQQAKVINHEWHAFKCAMGHEYALKVSVPIDSKALMRLYSDNSCPICTSKDLSRTETF